MRLPSSGRLSFMHMCIPLAVWIGYMLAMPADRMTFGYGGILALLFLAPILLRWHHFLLIAGWNFGLTIFFLPGMPAGLAVADRFKLWNFRAAPHGEQQGAFPLRPGDHLAVALFFSRGGRDGEIDGRHRFAFVRERGLRWQALFHVALWDYRLFCDDCDANSAQTGGTLRQSVFFGGL